MWNNSSDTASTLYGYVRHMLSQQTPGTPRTKSRAKNKAETSGFQNGPSSIGPTKFR
ncbi:hypothetical protein YC2023_029471 [Brassica napus]